MVGVPVLLIIDFILSFITLIYFKKFLEKKIKITSKNLNLLNPIFSYVISKSPIPNNEKISFPSLIYSVFRFGERELPPNLTEREKAIYGHRNTLERFFKMTILISFLSLLTLITNSAIYLKFVFFTFPAKVDNLSFVLTTFSYEIKNLFFFFIFFYFDLNFREELKKILSTGRSNVTTN